MKSNPTNAEEMSALGEEATAQRESSLAEQKSKHAAQQRSVIAQLEEDAVDEVYSAYPRQVLWGLYRSVVKTFTHLCAMRAVLGWRKQMEVCETTQRAVYTLHMAHVSWCISVQQLLQNVALKQHVYSVTCP